MNDRDRTALEQAARSIAGARRGVALTGAGISVDSGIPDFRSPGGLWERFDPLEYATLEAFRRDPAKVWRLLAEIGRIVAAARPNAGHRALAELERQGALSAVITQNIDNLHQLAGSRRVIEFHGNGGRLRCPVCDRPFPMPAAMPDDLPRCDHDGAVLKPDVVLFGETIPPTAAREAALAVAGCDVLLVIGTSAEVSPANQLPLTARRHGAEVIEINLSRTWLTDTVATLSLQGSATDLLPALAGLAGPTG